MFYTAYSPDFSDPYRVFYYDGRQVLFEKDHFEWYVTIEEAITAVAGSTVEDFDRVGAPSHIYGALPLSTKLPTYDELIANYPEYFI